MKKMTTEEILKTRLQTLIEALQCTFSQKVSNFTPPPLKTAFFAFLSEFDDSDGIIKKAILAVQKKFDDEFFSEDFEFKNLLVKVMILERVLAEKTIKGRGGGTVDKDFLDSQMFERIDFATNYAKTAKSLNLNFVDRNALGWGFSGGKGKFTKNSFQLVEKYSQILENSTRLKKLAEKIGHHSQSQGRIRINSERPAVSYCGIYNSDNIQTILPSELALNSNPNLQLEFLRKFADKQLLCYKPSPDKSAADGNKKDKGPVIICLDTSGSMHGIPEAIAKAITLGVVKSAASENREILIISFSTSFETMRINQLENADKMEILIDFLSSSFHGGTDISSALEHALLSAREKLSSADVLVISDFVSQDFSQNCSKKILDAKKRGTRFFAVSMGDRGNNNILKFMDETEVVQTNKKQVNFELWS